MPNLTFFRKESAFASDDLVPISMAALAVRLIMLCCSLGVAAYIGIRLDTCKPNLLAILIAFLFAAIFTNLLLVTVDCSALAVSTRGSIMSVHHREPLVHIMIGLQMILSLLEIAVSVLGAVSAWLPEVTNNHPCAVQTNVMKVVMGYTIIIWILLVAKVAYFLVLFDPLQCCSLQSASYVDDSEDEEDTPKYSQVVVTKRSWKHLGLRKEAVKVDNSQKSLYNTKTANLWFRYLSRLTNICACKSKANDKSALEAIAKAFAILLCEKTQQLVISDVVAAVLLTKREQVIKMKLFRDSVRVLTIQNMKEKTGQLVEKIGERFEPESYNYDARIRLDLTNPTQEDGFRLKRAIYFFQYSIGVYGWPMYCFQSPLTACCKLTYKTGALCPCRTSQYEFERPTSDRCGCNTSALALSAGLSKHNIVHISNHNEMFKAPYAVLVDHKLKTLVISIRGTMSIKDVLTDLSISLKEVRVNELPFSAMKTQVHLGMYQTAMNLAEELLKLKLLGIFFDRYPEYSLTIVGHSLGAGVASALALLFKIDERLQPYIAKGMECFAYSPPGCVFSYPLVQYSKSFVTSIVLNSDAVPCLNWRSLLFLKHSMLRQLRECEKPKPS